MALSQTNRGPAPWPEVHRSCRTGTSARLRKFWLTSRRMDQAQHGPFSIAAAYNARQSGSQVELSRILVSLEFECFLEKWL